MVQEYVNDRSVAVSVKAVKLTGRLLAKAIAATLRQMEKNRGKPKTGRQSYERLARDGKGTEQIEIMGRIQSFERFARKNKVSYHTEKDASTDPPKFTVYFKSAQKGNVTRAFKQYTELMLGKGTRKPSILAQLGKFRELLRSQVAERVRNKDHGGHEL